MTEPVPHRRAADATPRERRVGPSRLSTWSARRVAALWIVWPAIVAALVLAAAALSTAINHGTQEVPLAFTRANVRGLAFSALIPPACLTILWWRMRGRRRPGRELRDADTSAETQ